MRLPDRRILRSLVVVVLALCLTAAFAGTAFGALETLIGGTSKTNPNVGDGWWRQSWGNSLYPEFTLSVPSDGPETHTMGFIYKVSRDLSAFPDASDTWVNLTPRPEGTLTEHTVDLMGVFDNPPLGGWNYTAPPGTVLHQPYEGIWTIGFRFFNENRMANPTAPATFGVDVTPPRGVTGLAPEIAGVSPWTRRTFHWNQSQYDDLSGVAWYHVSVNGSETAKVYAAPHIPTNVTIENLPPGRSKIQIQAQDRATNLGPIVSTYTSVDSDVPTVRITAPAALGYVGGTYTFKADPRDKAGIQSVVFSVDGGALTYTDTAYPWQVAWNTKVLSAGAHTLSVTAKDLYGRPVTASETFYVDNTPIVISSVSAGPSPFYPIIKDGYKDYSFLSFYTNETANAMYLQVFDSLGRQILNRSQGSQRARRISVGWDGAGARGPGVYRARIAAYDRAGNLTLTGLYTMEIRNFEVVRIGPNQVRIIPR